MRDKLRAELLKKRTEHARRCVVRSLRAFYDHFRIAFPHLEALPQAYSELEREQNTSEEFKEDLINALCQIRYLIRTV